MDTDYNYRSITEDGTTDDLPETLPSTAGEALLYDDVLKLSRVRASRIANKVIHGGREDCVDLVRCISCDLDNLVLIPVKNGITVKGASIFNIFGNLAFDLPGDKQEIELGQFDNYWYPGRPPTQDNLFSGPGRNDGLPVRIRLWDAKVDDGDFLFGSGVEIIRVSKWIWYPYFLFQYARIRVENVIRKIRKQPLIATK